MRKYLLPPSNLRCHTAEPPDKVVLHPTTPVLTNVELGKDSHCQQVARLANHFFVLHVQQSLNIVEGSEQELPGAQSEDLGVAERI